MIDAGGDNPGANAHIANYLQVAAGDTNGHVHLDWALATHCHGENVGALPALLANPNITVDKLYIKPCDADFIHPFQRDDVSAHYSKVIAACQEHGVEVVGVLPDKAFPLGELTVQFFNTESIRGKVVYEDENSVGTKISCNGHSFFYRQ